MTIQLIEGNPNQKSLSFKVANMRLLKDFQTVTLSRNTANAGALNLISSAVTKLFEELGDLSKIDILDEKDGTVIALSGTEQGWVDPAMTAFEAEDILDKELKSGSDFINEAAIENQRNIEKIDRFDPEKIENPFANDTDKTTSTIFNFVAITAHEVFQESIAPTLKRDGGSMEITDLKVDFNTKTIHLDAITIASCYGCPTQGNTTNMAEGALNGALQEIQKEHNQVNLLQGLEFKVKSIDAPYGFALRK